MAPPDNAPRGKVASDPRRERERERDRALQELHGRGQVYAILDGARDPRVARLAVGSARSWCLYRGNLPAELAEVAPHLFHLRAGHDYADIYFRLGWRNAWGILLATTAGQPSLYRHLRTLLRARSEKKRLVFRYYDPRILRQYLPTCTPTELERFFGPISSLVVEAEEPHQFHLFRRSAAGFEHLRFEKDGAPLQAQSWPAAEPVARRGPMVLRQGQLDTLADPALRAFQDRMIDWVRRDFEEDFQRLQDSGVRKLVLKAKASAASYGMSSTAEVTGLLSLMLVLQDEDFETRDANEWMLAILRSPSIPGAQKFRMILQQQLESI